MTSKEAPITDQETIKLILSGHGEAYGDLIRQYHRKVVGYCLSMLSNSTDAEEAAQDIFVKVYHALKKFKGDSSFSTWLYRITANHCLDVLRKRNRRKTVSWEGLVEQQGDQILSLFSTSQTGESQLENRELIDKILSTLPADYRAILTLREVDGLEYQEISEALGCSLDAVKGRLARARKQLTVNLRHFTNPSDVYTDKKKES